jgi:hypothetical protein
MSFLTNLMQPDGVQELIEADKLAAKNEYERSQGFEPDESIDEEINRENAERAFARRQQQPKEEPVQVKPPTPSQLKQYKEQLMQKIRDIDGKKIKKQVSDAGLKVYKKVDIAANEIAKQTGGRKISARELGRRAAAVKQTTPKQKQDNTPIIGRTYDSGMYTQTKRSASPQNNSGTQVYDSGWYTSRTSKSVTPDNRSAMDVLFGDRMHSKRPKSQNNEQYKGGLYALSSGQFKIGYTNGYTNPTKKKYK